MPNNNLVIDFGTNATKAGHAGRDKPTSVTPSLAGTPRHVVAMTGMNGKKIYWADEAQNCRGMLQLQKIFLRGSMVHNWELFEKFVHYLMYNELRVEPEEYNLLVTDAVLSPMHQRSQMMQLLFEKFLFCNLQFANQSVMSLYFVGATSGIALDCGDGICQAVPMVDGTAVGHAVMRWDRGGVDVTRLLYRLLGKQMKVQTGGDLECIRDAKEKLLYNYNMEKDFKYELPDGTILTVDTLMKEQVQKALFEPATILQQPNAIGVHERLHNTILKCNSEQQEQICQRIVVTGGASKMQDFGDTVKNYLKSSKQLKVGYVSHEAHPYAAWMGAAAVVSLSSFQKQALISKAEYEEMGPNVLQTKRFII